ncbi:Hypothetical protein A7982_01478 [Minicystis rosea]|nr:Hypothetical protein A7982_01478 [Minicystis rosea]
MGRRHVRRAYDSPPPPSAWNRLRRRAKARCTSPARPMRVRRQARIFLITSWPPRLWTPCQYRCRPTFVTAPARRMRDRHKGSPFGNQRANSEIRGAGQSYAKKTNRTLTLPIYERATFSRPTFRAHRRSPSCFACD